MSDQHDSSSSLGSYSNLFEKNRHNFTASSEISLIDHLEDDEHNRTFTKEISKTLINAFTGKPISPNPWRKLCTKIVHRQTDTDVIVPIELCPPSSRSHEENRTQTICVDMINNPRATDSTNDQAFEQFLEEHRTPMVIKHQPNTPVLRRRKKRNSLKELPDRSSSSSTDNIKEQPPTYDAKINRLTDNDPSWQRLADVYTSEDSDDKNHLLSSNMSYTVRLKSEIYTSDQSSSSTSSTKSVSLINDEKKSPCNFLQSLAERIPFDDKHLDAQPYFLPSGFTLKNQRQELANKLLHLFNDDVFSSQLADKVSVVWSGRLTATAGHCTTRKATRTAVITLSHKVCDSPERCRDTLLHEMCHAAVTLIDGVMEYGHGPLWRQWTRLAEHSYPYLPSISIRHTYDVNYKYIYRCIQCDHEVYRHSKSLQLDVDMCGKCLGKFHLIINENIDEKQTPKKTVNRYNLYVKEHFQLIKQAHPHLSTPQLMKQLSREYKQKTIIDLPDFDQLKL